MNENRSADRPKGGFTTILTLGGDLVLMAGLPGDGRCS
jgi:hypothetical protein